MGEYAHELIKNTYINLISQAQSGQCLCIEGQMLDIKIGNSRRIPNTDRFINGYRMGKYAINYQQNTAATIAYDYDENANLTIAIDGFLIQEQLENLDYPSGTIVYNGSFKNVTQEGFNILEKCLNFSALNYDLFLDKDLLQIFSKTIKQSNGLLNELPLLDDKKQKL